MGVKKNFAAVYQHTDKLTLLSNLFFDPRSQGLCKRKQCSRLQTEDATEDSLAVTYIASEGHGTFIARTP